MTEGPLTVALDTRLSETLVDEGLVREVTSKLQQLRKDGGYAVSDRVRVVFGAADERLRRVMLAAAATIGEEVLAISIEEGPGASALDVNGLTLRVSLTKG